MGFPSTKPLSKTNTVIERCRLCGGENLREWMKDGRNRDLVY
jgi:hypothetical protein